MKKLIAFGAVLGVLLITVHGLNWLSVPHHLRASNLETRYKKQIDRLHEIAFDRENRWNVSPEVCDADRSLFNLPELLHASVQPVDGTYCIVGSRTFDEVSEWSWVTDTLRFPGSVRYWFTLADGRKVSAVGYTDSISDVDGREVMIHLTIQLPNAETRAEQDEAGQSTTRSSVVTKTNFKINSVIGHALPGSGSPAL